MHASRISSRMSLTAIPSGDSYGCSSNAGRKVFLILDNVPCHNLKADGIRWLRENSHRISLHRLPPYSPEFNPVEPIWKTTRKLATHNRFYQTTIERDTALRRAFQRFYANPALIRAHVAR